MYVVCCAMSTVVIACCKFQSEVNSRVSCTQMKTPIVFNKSKAWLVTSFIIFLKRTNTLQNVFFWSIMGILCSNSSFVMFPLVLFFSFVLWKDEHELQKKLATFQQWLLFFKWASSPIVFSSLFFFNLGHLLFMVVFFVQACHPCGPPLAPPFCVPKKMSSKEKLKCWINEHHLFSSEQVHQLPPHDYNLCDHGCLMFMVILCSSSSPLWCPLALFFFLWKKEHEL